MRAPFSRSVVLGLLDNHVLPSLVSNSIRKAYECYDFGDRVVSSLREHATQIIFGSHTGLNTQEEGGCNTCEQGSNGSSDSALMVAVSACAAATKTIGKAVATGWRPMLKAAGHAWAAVKSAVRSTARVVQYQVQQALIAAAIWAVLLTLVPTLVVAQGLWTLVQVVRAATDASPVKLAKKPFKVVPLDLNDLDNDDQSFAIGAYRPGKTTGPQSPRLHRITPAFLQASGAPRWNLEAVLADKKKAHKTNVRAKRNPGHATGPDFVYLTLTLTNEDASAHSAIVFRAYYPFQGLNVEDYLKSLEPDVLKTLLSNTLNGRPFDVVLIVEDGYGLDGIKLGDVATFANNQHA